ncbi:MAG: Nif3-like dinuclear metal center hexameric protein [Candidatus Thorarchaeota archaeon]|nr:MAG: Nif3-like dinuclear metal center hexameric protein [Candidatus Thorarchaeota archaeon]
MTTLLEIVKYLRGIAPRDYTIRGHDSRVEIGPQSDSDMINTTISRVVITTYLSGAAVTKATQEKANLVITFRPLFPFIVDRITGLDLKRIRLLSKNYISSYVLGSGWVGVKDGMADALCDLLGLKRLRDFVVTGDLTDVVPAGRVCGPSDVMNHSRFSDFVADKLGMESVTFSGDLDDEVQSILIFPGSYIDISEIISAKSEDVGTIVTGELAPDVRMMAHEEGISTLELGPFVTEDPGMERLRHQMSLEFPELKVEFYKSLSYTRSLTRR